jgi:hypothetical protein
MDDAGWTQQQHQWVASLVVWEEWALCCEAQYRPAAGLFLTLLYQEPPAVARLSKSRATRSVLLLAPSSL